MYKRLYLLLAIVIGLSCKPKPPTLSEVAENHYAARNKTDYQVIMSTISDSLTVIEGDYVMPYSHDSYHEVFKWDSVFQTQYEQVAIETTKDQVVISLRLTSIRNDFLQDEPMTCAFRLSYDAGKISKIEALDCKGADWSLWQQRVNDLVSWTKTHHPELDGFINDMTQVGAEKYVKAIALYKSK